MNIRELRQEVANHLTTGDGHGMDHIIRVDTIAKKFAAHESANKEVVELAVLLHDVDDYKLFGKESAETLVNTRRFLDAYEASAETSERVIRCIGTMGYNKYLEGIRPSTIEGMVVSDADMCDALGAEGILRTHAYALASGHEFFDESMAPLEGVKDATVYRSGGRHSVQHFFDKLLLLPDIMMTQSGKEEAARRKEIMVSFLRQLFKERHSPEWEQHLDDFIGKQQ